METRKGLSKTVQDLLRSIPKRITAVSDERTLAVAASVFTVYLLFLLYRLFFHAYGGYFRSRSSEADYNLMPFKTIAGFMTDFAQVKFSIWFFNLFGNILAFMPLGFLLPLIFAGLNDYKKITLAAIIVSSSVEFAQYLTRLGTADIDDVILNTAGAVLGYMLLYFCRMMLNRKIMYQDNELP